jgi:hypothetical protein
VESVLEIAVDYGDKTFLGDLKPGSTPGVYWMEIMPTVRGTYTVRLAGTLADQTVNVSLSPEEVLAAKVLQFPATAPDSRDLGQQLDTLRTQLNTTNQLAMASLVLAALAIIGLCANLFITIKKKKVNHENTKFYWTVCLALLLGALTLSACDARSTTTLATPTAGMVHTGDMHDHDMDMDMSGMLIPANGATISIVSPAMAVNLRWIVIFGWRLKSKILT